MDIHKLAWEIYGALKGKGVDLGTASVPIIVKVIKQHQATEQGAAAELLPSDEFADDFDHEQLGLLEVGDVKQAREF